MYGELIIALNMVFNYAVLSFANKVGNIQSRKRRLILASFIGAVPVTIFPSSVIAILMSFLFMTVCAFGKSVDSWKKSAMIVLIGAVFAGGLLTAFQYQVDNFDRSVSVLISAVIAYVSLYFMRKKWLDVRISKRVSAMNAESILSIWGKEVSVNVFVDTGNNCTEPLSDAPVHFISMKVLEDIIPNEIKGPLFSWDPLKPGKLTEFPTAFMKNIRLIKILTVQGNSWAIGFKFDKWIIDGGAALEKGYIVLTKEDQRYPENAGAILHVSAMEMLNEERGTVHVA